MREESGLNKGWRFTTSKVEELPYDAYFLTKTGAQTGAAAMAFDDKTWQVVDLPHDYTVSGNLDPLYNDYNGYLNRPNAWYRRYFYLDEADCGKRLVLHFEGVSGESKVWVNGCLMKVNYSSFCGFDIDISDVVRFGRAVNVIAVYLDNHCVEGWWYQAGGIYRRVSLIKTEIVYIVREGCVITSQKGKNDTWNIHVDMQVGTRKKAERNLQAIIEIKDVNGKLVYEEQADICMTERTKKVEFNFELEHPLLWDIGKGNLYECRLKIADRLNIIDTIDQKFGIREFEFRVEDGFVLNGKHQEIKGLCYHEDEGNLGWAIDKETYEKRVRNLVEMGGNAYRCSHNPPAEELLEICDRYGVLVVDEARKFDPGEIGLAELCYMIRRDRNHPSIILWSMGNEEPWQGEDRGARIMETMREAALELDPTRPVTMAMDHGFLNDGAALYSDVVGINYNHELFDEVHKKYPDKPMIGSENLSLADHFQDGLRTYTGSDKAYETLELRKSRPFVSGTFGWAGQEYRGEHRNLSFFTNCCPTDCTGGIKDGFYQYAAYWKPEPVLHICGHWNDTGEVVRKVRIYTNAEEVELYLNGKFIERKEPNARNEVVFHVTYEKGTLEAIGYKKSNAVVKDQCVTTSEVKRFILTPEKKCIKADGKERVFITVEAVDDAGLRYPTASEEFHVELKGPGRILCCDNADAYSTWWDTPQDMNVYNGMARIVIEAGTSPGILEVELRSKMLIGCSCQIEVLPAEVNEVETCISPYVNEWFVSYVFSEKPDIYQWPTDDYYITWRKYWEPATLILKELPFYHRKGYVICCQEQNLPEMMSDKHPALVFERISGKAEFLISARDYNNKIVKRVFYKKDRETAEQVKIELPGFKTGDRMIMKVLVEGKKADDGIIGNVRFEL